MNVLLERLTETCHNLLLRNDELMKYLKDKRQLTDGTIKSYRLGAFPKDLRVLYNHVNAEELKKQEIIWNAGDSPFQQYPIVIPIRDFMGNTVAIGGRTLLSDDARKRHGLPKYRNSSYTKTAHLYGLDKAKESIRDLNRVYVVEGYFDAIMAHQKGICNVVATCGTLFSSRQLIILSRYTENICLLFDNDEAGHTSANRVMQKLGHSSDVNLEYKFTPDGSKDLDEFLRGGGDFTFIDNKAVSFENVEVNTLW